MDKLQGFCILWEGAVAELDSCKKEYMEGKLSIKELQVQ